MTTFNKFWELENNYLKNSTISDPSDNPNLYYVNINDTIMLVGFGVGLSMSAITLKIIK